jgi:hypothetical protein
MFPSILNGLTEIMACTNYGPRETESLRGLLDGAMSVECYKTAHMMMMQTSMLQNLMVQKQTEGPPDTPTGTMDGASAGTEITGGAVRTMPTGGDGATESRMVRPRLDVKPEKMELDHKVEDGLEEPVDGDF